MYSEKLTKRGHKPSLALPLLWLLIGLLLPAADVAAEEFCSATSAGVGDSLIDNVAAALQAAKCALTDSGAWPADHADAANSVEQLQDLTYDYIVAGGGSAGSIVASRLSEQPNVTVLLLEAGQVPPLESEMFNLSPTLHHDSRFMWLHEGEQNPQCCQAMEEGRGCSWPHGRMLGGTGAINGNFFLPGSAADFQHWRQQLGLVGWGWPEVHLLYRRLLTDKLRLSYFRPQPLEQQLTELMYAATAELGVPRVRQPLTSGTSFGYTHAVPVTVEQGRRASSGRKYLAGVGVRERANLHVMRGAIAEQVLLANPKTGLRARGVRYRLPQRGNATLRAHARLEVVVSTGAINSPKLLLQSGIGPRQHLQHVGVRVQMELPVGENLHDHGMLPLLLQFGGRCAVNSSAFHVRSAYDPASVAEYLLQQQSGPLSDGFSLMGFLNSSQPQDTGKSGTRPDLHLVAHTLLPRGSAGSFGYLGFRQELVAALQAALQSSDMLQVMGSLLLPRSRGQVRLRTADPAAPPLILNNFGAHAEDQAVLLRFVRYMQRMTRTRPFRRCGLQLWRPPLPACDPLTVDSDDYWLCYIRHFFVSAWHPVGTCRMGALGEAAGVVDARLRVRGINGLRVVDASVMPEITAGNTNAPTLMIAENGARMIIADRVNMKPIT